MKPHAFTVSPLTKALLAALTLSTLTACLDGSSSNSSEEPNVNTQTVTLYYKADDHPVAYSAISDLYQGLTLHLWNDENCSAYADSGTDWNNGLVPSGIDNQYGAYWELNVNANDSTQCLNFIPHIGDDKPLGNWDGRLDLKQLSAGNKVYTQQGVAGIYPELIAKGDIAKDHVRIYLNQSSDNPVTGDPRLYFWNEGECQAAAQSTSWPGIAPTGESPTYGYYWDLLLKENLTEDDCLNIIPNSTAGWQTANLAFEISKQGAFGALGMVFKDVDKVYYQPLAHLPASEVSLAGAQALLAGDAFNTVLIADPEVTKVTLYTSSTARLEFDAKTKTVTGYDESAVFSSDQTTDSTWQDKPYLSSFKAFSLDITPEQMKTALKGQLWLAGEDSSGLIMLTKVQPAGALDALYASQAKAESFGASVTAANTEFRLWAPTAKSVTLVPYNQDLQPQTPIAMNFNTASGSWSATTDQVTEGDYYRYQLEVYHPTTDKIETYEITDPYSLSLSKNSGFSQVINLDNPSTKPAGWDDLTTPHTQENPASFVLYEAHIRDFSSNSKDSSIKTADRGKYSAFGDTQSEPVKHLTSLAQAGVTHLHLLPSFDIATINEDDAKVINISDSFSTLCDEDATVSKDADFGSYCTSQLTIEEAMSELVALDTPANPVVSRLNQHLHELDSFNWGYDPFHYTVPEGSYAHNAEGAERIKEFRQMVMDVKKTIGMNLVLDVVYNHTHSAGLDKYSVLDKAVPWYYQRLNPQTGAVENSTCCSNSAPENAMFAKLIADSIVTWTKDYKVDAFRWDLMGHHPLAQIQETLAAAKAVNPDMYFYGEGWNFGEVENDHQFVQATQPHLGGTGIGSFSDRLRDAVRGGGPFDEKDGLRENQGFGNGAFVQPNNLSSTSEATALHLADLIRLGMAGNLADFSFIDSKGNTVLGNQVDYNGQAAGYAQDASETINYVSKHDNQTLWDNNQYKIPYDVDADTRVRMQAVSLSTALLGQGVPFIHMGSELLRSKSMQRDSYNSGDWYNRVDFTKQSNNWNVGLPRSDKDGSNYEIITQVIQGAGERAQVDADNIANMNDYFKELVELRASSGLFSLNIGDEIKSRLAFHNTGADQLAGVIVMSIDNSGDKFDATIDAQRQGIVVVINARPTNLEFEGFDATDYQLHSISAAKGAASLAHNAQVVDGKLQVPAWSSAVFEKHINE